MPVFHCSKYLYRYKHDIKYLLVYLYLLFSITNTYFCIHVQNKFYRPEAAFLGLVK